MPTPPWVAGKIKCHNIRKARSKVRDPKQLSDNSSICCEASGLKKLLKGFFNIKIFF